MANRRLKRTDIFRGVRHNQRHERRNSSRNERRDGYERKLRGDEYCGGNRIDDGLQSHSAEHHRTG